MSTYERDFYAWTQNQATLLRSHEFAHLDIDNLSEEIEAMGRSERRQLTNRLEVLLAHLLKWQFQPERRGRSWRSTVSEQRRRIARLLRDNPSLQPDLPLLLADAYQDARHAAADETGLDVTIFPAASPYPLEDVLAAEWLPA
ncbi:MAG: DUF29 family protein [Caldilineaceae bacterium]|nr:DUF29 family protein [Caldilineaceae bacterium]HRJ41462.1 DUF29 domain-containing protein [Caldilineaceae bacterium]